MDFPLPLQNSDPDPFRAWLRPRLKAIHPRIHRVPARLVQFQVEPAKQRGKPNAQLRVRELDADAAARALAKRHHVARERLAIGCARVVAKPALRLEGVAGWEDGLVVRDGVDVHADDGAGGDGVRGVADGVVVRAWVALRDAVREA